MLTRMRHASATIELEILRVPPGSPFLASELRRHGGATTVRVVLDRMQALGLVVRVDAGVYVRPVRDGRGEAMPPSLDALLEAIRRADRCALQPVNAQDDQSFTFWTTGRARTLHLGPATVRLRRPPIGAVEGTTPDKPRRLADSMGEPIG